MEDGRIPAQERLHTQPGKSKTVADILTAAADLIEPEGAWIQGDMSRDADGCPWGRNPVCWCMIGALSEACETADEDFDDGGFSEARALIASVIGTTPGEGLPHWNDAPERTQAEVVAALRAAAEKARTAAETGSVGMEPQSGGMRP